MRRPDAWHAAPSDPQKTDEFKLAEPGPAHTIRMLRRPLMRC
jgi:hypothetical protein